MRRLRSYLRSIRRALRRDETEPERMATEAELELLEAELRLDDELDGCDLSLLKRDRPDLRTPDEAIDALLDAADRGGPRRGRIFAAVLAWHIAHGGEED